MSATTRLVTEAYLLALEKAHEDLEIAAQCLQELSDEAEEAQLPPLFLAEREQFEASIRAVNELIPWFTPSVFPSAPWHLQLRARLFGEPVRDGITGNVFAHWYRGQLVVVRDPKEGP